MNTFLYICITYIVIYLSVKIGKWIFFDAIPRIESREGKRTIIQLFSFFFIFSFLMILARLFFK